jgi:capsular polysaccharide biosynthesis protein
MKNNNDDEIEIDLLKLVKALWSKALIIILCALLVASMALGYTLMFTSPTYEATASMYVNNSSFSFGSTSFSISSSELSASTSLVNIYIYILESRTTLEDVIARSGVSYTYEQLSSMIDAEAVSNTAAFNVTVTSTSPTEAELIANTIAKVLPDRISEIVDGASVRIVDYAIVPSHRAGPSYTKNTLIGFIAGAFLAAAVITVQFLIAEQNDVVIHSSDELRKLYPDINVLALIPDMRLPEDKGYYYSSYYGNSKGGK